MEFGVSMECGVSMFNVHLFYPRSHHTWNVLSPSFPSQIPPHLECSTSIFSSPVPTSAWMKPKRNSHGSASLARADRKKTLGISSGSLGEKYSWISPLKFTLLPVNPHWKSWEVFPNGMSSHELGNSGFQPFLACKVWKEPLLAWKMLKFCPFGG